MIRVSAATIKNASDTLELVRLLSTSEGIGEALGQMAQEREALDAREADLQTRENAILARVSEAEAAEAKSAKAVEKADRKIADAASASDRAKADLDTLSYERLKVASREKEAVVRSASLDARERGLDVREKGLDEAAVQLDERAGALDAREAEIEAREQRLRAALAG